jgi:type II secretory pathway pseudopilin PulG
LNRIKGSVARGFSTLEMTVVMGIIFIILGAVSLNMVTLLDDAKSETALSTMNAVFKAARQASLAQREERRVVIRVSYDGDARGRAEVYELQPRFEFYVDRTNVPGNWDDVNLSAPLTDVHSLQGTAIITDINGVSLVPQNVGSGTPTPDGRRTFESYIVFDSRGRISRFYQQGQDFEETPDLQCNLAVHVMFGSTVVPLQGPGSQGLDYLDLVAPPLTGSNSPPCASTPAAGLEFAAAGNESNEIGARTLSQTLYLIRLTGQSMTFDYGIYYPWENLTIPEDFFQEEA